MVVGLMAAELTLVLVAASNNDKVGTDRLSKDNLSASFRLADIMEYTGGSCSDRNNCVGGQNNGWFQFAFKNCLSDAGRNQDDSR